MLLRCWPQSVEQVVALYRGIPAHFSSLLLSSITRDGRIKTKNCVSGVMDRKNSSQASVNSSEQNKWMIEVTRWQ